MSLFPFVEIEENEVEEIKELPLYRDVAWDFTNNDIKTVNGEPVFITGNEALKTWIYKALMTNKYEHEIYSSEYGSELKTLIGLAYSPSLTKAEAKRYIEEALLINPYIVEVSVKDISFKGDKLSVYIDVVTIYGNTKVVI